jgi:hypothetical protein
MALKFRRGTTAQKSGSLAFGEPYVNTTLGTLQIGGPDGDITLGSTGTGSAGNFGAISGSGLDITGNANIGGNLTVGGQLTIGDATSDTVNVVASLSSSLIPSVNNAFDLGSPSKIWRDLYISTGSIRMMDASGNEVAVLSSTATGMAFDADISVNGVKVGLGGGNQLGNTVLGDSGLSQNTTGNSNTMIGSTAGAANTTGNDNTYVGRLAGFSNHTSQGNTAVGAETMYQNTGSANTAIGFGALKRNKDGAFNIAMGYLAGQYATGSSNNNVFIGFNNGPQTESEVNHQLYIGPGYDSSLIRGHFQAAELRINGKLDVRDDTVVSGSLTVKNHTVLSGSLTTFGHILPATTNTYDLGSETKFWRDIYVSTGSIKFVGAAGTVVGTLTNVGNGLNLDGGIVTNGNSTFGTSSLSTTAVTGSLLVNGNVRVTNGGITGSIAATNGVVSGSLQIASDISASLSAAHLNSKVAGIVSGSSQVTISDTTGFSTYSTSVDSRITTEKGRVDAILSAADADKDTFAEIVTLINSVDLSNDTAFASFYTASVGRLNNLESTSASLMIETANLETFSSSALTRLSTLETETANLESFTSSINTTIKTRLNAETVVSGSSQVIGILSSLNTYTGSNDTTNTTQNSRLDQLSTASGSAISRLSALEVETANLESFSSSALTRLSNLEGTDITITLTGDVTGTGTITNLGNVSFATTVAANQVALGTDTTGDYVASLVAGTGVTLSNNSGESATPTIAIGQSVATSANAQFNSLGIGMAASATAGRIDATNDIVAYSSSDIRFKENITPIENPIQKIRQISGNTYDWKEENKIEHGYEGNDVGVIAQEIEAVLPQLVQTRDNGYKAVKYDKLVALLIEGIKEQQIQIDNLTLQVEELKKQKGL